MPTPIKANDVINAKSIRPIEDGNFMKRKFMYANNAEMTMSIEKIEKGVIEKFYLLLLCQ